MSAISLPEWRARNGKNLREIAQALGLGGRNPARTLHRYETGERACPVGVAVSIEALTEGVVPPSSFAEARERHLSTATDHDAPTPRLPNCGENGAAAACCHVNSAAAALPVGSIR